MVVVEQEIRQKALFKRGPGFTLKKRRPGSNPFDLKKNPFSKKGQAARKVYVTILKSRRKGNTPANAVKKRRCLGPQKKSRHPGKLDSQTYCQLH